MKNLSWFQLARPTSFPAISSMFWIDSPLYVGVLSTNCDLPASSNRTEGLGSEIEVGAVGQFDPALDQRLPHLRGLEVEADVVMRQHLGRRAPKLPMCPTLWNSSFRRTSTSPTCIGLPGSQTARALIAR